MPSISEITSGASLPLSAGLALMHVPTPWTAAAGAALGLVGLVSQIGQGRKTANKMTQNGGPQDILNKQLAAIDTSDAPADEKAQATDMAWRGFLAAANQFAATQGPRAAQVVQQAIYKTPELTNTVKTLLGKDPLDPSYTSVVSNVPSATSPVNTGGVPWGQIALTAGAAAAPFAINAIRGGSVSAINNPDAPSGPTPALDTEGNPVLSPTGVPLDTSGAPITGGGGATPSANANSPSTPGGSLLPRLLPNLISSGTSLLGGVLGYRAATGAAGVQSDAALRAAQLLAQTGKYSTDAQTAALQKTLEFNRDVLGQQQQNIQPWVNAGASALTKISDITNAPGFSWNKTFTPPTTEQIMSDPGVQAQLQLGQQALEQFERAHGKLLTGGAIKDINQFAQTVAKTSGQDVFNRQLAAYNTNYQTFAAERQAQLNPEFQLAGLGESGTGNLNANLSTAANLNTGAQLGTARTIADINQATAGGVAQQQTSAAAARASGYVGGSNALTGAFGNVGNNLLQMQTIQQLLQALGRQPANA